MCSSCPTPYTNPTSKDWTAPPLDLDSRILDFHRTLPDYSPTPLVRLDDLAASLGIRSLYIKDESKRFGLPSFKILGASWAIYRATCARLELEPSIPLRGLAEAASKTNVSLVTCSDGNWGRAVARMAKYLAITATIFVPENIDEATRKKISGEGATCRVCPGDYDASIRAARKLADETEGALLVMDTSWESYKTVPQWVTDGYSTMLREVSAVVPSPTVVIVSVGVGSWAHSAVAHYKQQRADVEQRTAVVTVETITAASLLTSLHAGQIVSIETGDTIMCGMNCGTTSDIAWPYLRDGVDAAITVSDRDSHDAVEQLKSQRSGVIDPGPCGAAPLAALRKLLTSGLLGDLHDAEVVLFCTEGARNYVVPDPQDMSEAER